MEKRKGCLFVISGPSGVGKGTLREKLFQCIPGLKYSVSVTSRKPRENEIEGKDYYFVDEEKFKKYIKENKFAEWALVYGEYKGTLWKTIQESTERGEDLVLEIDVQGAMQIQKKFPNGVFIFIAPPSWEKLEYRLRNRNTEGEKELQKRLSEAHDEMKYVQYYNYLIINHHLEKALKELTAIIISEKCKIRKDERAKNNNLGSI